MQRIVVVAARGPVYRKLVVAAAMVVAGIALERAEVAAIGWALAARLPAVYLTLAGTDADAERIAEAIRRRIS